MPVVTSRIQELDKGSLRANRINKLEVKEKLSMNMKPFWWLALAFTLMWIWFEWMQFSAPVPLTADVSQVQEQFIESEIPGVPNVNRLVDDSVPSAIQGLAIPDARVAMAQGQRIHVQTDVFDVVIDTHGGDIRSVHLREHQATHDRTQNFQLMSDQGKLFHIAQNGIAVTANSLLPAPTHKSIFQATQTNHILTGDTLVVPMTWEQDGIKVTKTYTFTRGTHLIEVNYRVENRTNLMWSGSLYSQLVRGSYDPEHRKLMYTFTGPVLFDPHAENMFTRHSFNDLETEPVQNRSILGGWTAMIQHHFLTAVIPDQNTQNSFYIRPLSEDRFVTGVVKPLVEIPPGQTANLTTDLYMGPIIQNVLRDVAPGLERTVDYGIFTLLAKPIFWLLSTIYSVIGNWGWAIIVLTILIKVLFYKLSEKSYRSMARLKKFQPKLKQLKEHYGDDKAIFQQKMMKLYKEEKINPLGGCLPILVQMPVFIALYWVVLYSAEMRQAEWILWINDLSATDPYFILPVIMGVTMYIQQRLNPSVMMDEMQQKIMKLLPFVFTIFFMFFPAGLVLYWVVNNILSVAQQSYITRKIESGEYK